MKSVRTAVTVASCLALGACSSIGTINGVSLNSDKRMGATETSRDTWCEQNDQRRWTCILLAAGAVGGAVAIMASRDKKKPAPAPVEEGGGEEGGGT